MFALPAWWYSNRGYPRSNEARSSCRTDTNSVIKAEPEVFGFHTPSGGKGIFQSTTPRPAENILLAGACKGSPRVDDCAAQHFQGRQPRHLNGERLFAIGDAGDGCYRLDHWLLKVVVASRLGEERISGGLRGHASALMRFNRGNALSALKRAQPPSAQAEPAGGCCNRGSSSRS